MGRPYEIVPYSIASLKQVLQDKSGALQTVVDGKLHTVYFDNYFDHLKAKTIIIENEYVDKDFLEDYAGFYSRCFGKYDSACTRLHFFDKAFSQKQFSYTLVGKGKTLTAKQLQKGYLGFVVVRACNYFCVRDHDVY